MSSFIPESFAHRLLHLTFSILVFSGAAMLMGTRCFADTTSYNQISGPCSLRFPADHGAHPGYRTEWWYYTGNLWSSEGKHYGFQLTFFRSQISPNGSEQLWPEPHSKWRTNQIYLAHAAISDISAGRFFHSERAGRGIPDLAGVNQERDTVSIWLQDWSVQLAPEGHKLTASTDDFAFTLQTKPQKEPVLHGDRGYSLKGKSPESASCYYSLTRLLTEGTLTLQGKEIPVSGAAWMDHEFSSSPLEQDLVGWDWFSLQFNNNTELMVYFLREKDGSFSSASSATFVSDSGGITQFRSKEIQAEVLKRWKSPHSGADYPSQWRLRIPALKMDLLVSSNLEDQEMQTPESTRVTYWEGSVSARGVMGEMVIAGNGYMELTGYASPFDAPM